jgi:hypothetical protein
MAGRFKPPSPATIKLTHYPGALCVYWCPKPIRRTRPGPAQTRESITSFLQGTRAGINVVSVSQSTWSMAVSAKATSSVKRIFMGLGFAVATCACSLQPSITATNVPDNPHETGGVLHISGTGFSNDQGCVAQIGAISAPGHPRPFVIGQIPCVNGSFNDFTWRYTINPYAYPRCYGVQDLVNVTISGADVETSSPSFATVQVWDCPWTNIPGG